jgi:nitrogen fixation protein NifU and related proteins
MNEKNFDFFQDHSRHYLEMALRTDRLEIMKTPDGYGKKTGECGDTVVVFMRVVGDIIQAISFLVDGCINTTACCNTVAHLVEGRRVEDAWEITPEAVVDYLETLPSGHAHCAELSVGALYLALSDIQEHNRASWKKIYSGASNGT